jgi:hypothetical protein
VETDVLEVLAGTVGFVLVHELSDVLELGPLMLVEITTLPLMTVVVMVVVVVVRRRQRIAVPDVLEQPVFE